MASNDASTKLDAKLPLSSISSRYHLHWNSTLYALTSLVLTEIRFCSPDCLVSIVGTESLLGLSAGGSNSLFTDFPE